VGFRWQVDDLAQSISCTGYVKNLRDGSVEVVMEGRKKDLLQLIKSIDRKMSGYWQDKTVDQRPGDAHYNKFSIRY
jgi:acylphosphatase